MSKYTTELRNICESFSDKPFNLNTGSIDDIIEDLDIAFSAIQ